MIYLGLQESLTLNGLGTILELLKKTGGVGDYQSQIIVSLFSTIPIRPIHYMIHRENPTELMPLLQSMKVLGILGYQPR